GVLSGTLKTIWSSPTQHPERPWYATSAFTPPSHKVSGIPGMFCPSPTPDTSLPLTGPSPVPQTVRVSPGLAEPHAVRGPPQLAALAAETRLKSGKVTIAGPCPLESSVRVQKLLVAMPWETG